MIELTPQQQQFVDAQVATGVFKSRPRLWESPSNCCNNANPNTIACKLRSPKSSAANSVPLTLKILRRRGRRAQGPTLMLPLLLRTAEAIADLDGIWDYISRAQR